MLAVEDQLDALAWVNAIGGLSALISRSEHNLEVIASWVETSSWVSFLANDDVNRSNTSICLKVKDTWFTQKSAERQADVIKRMVKLLADENVAFDIGGYRDAPAGLRIWGGGTVEATDTEKLLPWLDWAYTEVKSC